MAKQKNPAAVALGKLGGKKGGKARMQSLTAKEREELARKGGKVGGKARAANLTPNQRSLIANKAAAARWGKNKAEQPPLVPSQISPPKPPKSQR